MSKLAEKIQSGRLAITAECIAPAAADVSAFKKMASCFPASLDAVVVADNPDQTRGSAMACAAILAGEKLPATLSLVTRDRNRIALESDVLGAAALGVQTVVCLSGDHQSLGICPQAAGAYDIDSIQLTKALRTMNEQGLSFDGQKLAAAPKLFLGAVAHPYLRPMELNLIRLRKKVLAGAKFVLTQAAFDLAGFTEWMNAVTAAGIDKTTAIIASVLPLTSVEKAKELQARQTYGPIGNDVIERLAKAADPAKEGVAIASQLAAKLKTVPGVRGIHILSGGCEATVAGIIQQAGLA